MNFSVSVCVYFKDDPLHFYDALQSVINQTIIPSEIVCVIEGQVGTEIHSVISEIQQKYKNFKKIQLKENMGHGKARQIGIENCAYDLVALMDSDDLCVPDRFEMQIKLFKEDANLSIVGGWIEEFNNNIANSIAQRKLPQDDLQIKKYLKYRCPMNQVTVMFKKNDVLKAGGYLDWYHEEDYYLWLRMYLQDCKFKNIQKVLVHVRATNSYFSRREALNIFKRGKASKLYV